MIIRIEYGTKDDNNVYRDYTKVISSSELNYYIDELANKKVFCIDICFQKTKQELFWMFRKNGKTEIKDYSKDYIVTKSYQKAIDKLIKLLI